MYHASLQSSAVYLNRPTTERFPRVAKALISFVYAPNQIAFESFGACIEDE